MIAQSERFDGIEWNPTDTGLPRLDGCSGWFEIGIRSRHEEGEHLILVGRVESFEIVGGRPLVFHNSQFAELADAPTGARAPHR